MVTFETFAPAVFGFGGLFLILWMYFFIKDCILFKALKNVQRGQSVDALKKVDLKPTILHLDNQTKIWCYSRILWFRLLWLPIPSKRIEKVMFTVVDGKIVYTSEQ